MSDNCSWCGRPRTGGPGMRQVEVNCGFCTGGVNRCTRCTWSGGVRLMCCGYCDDGYVQCTQRGCRDGRRRVNQVCVRPHNQPARR